MPRRIGFSGSSRQWIEMAGQGYNVYQGARHLYNTGRRYYDQARGLYRQVRPYVKHAQGIYSSWQDKKVDQTSSRQKIIANNRTTMRGAGGGSYQGKAVKKLKPVKSTKAHTFTYESQGTLSDYQCVYLSHNTFSIQRATRIIMYGCIRALLSMIGQDTNRETGSGYDLDGIFFIKYRGTPMGTATDASVFTVSVGTPQTITQIVNQYVDFLHRLWQPALPVTVPPGLGFPSAVIISISFLPQIDATASNMSSMLKTVNMQQSKIEIKVKSELKIQNVTRTRDTTLVNDDPESATNVEASPIHGLVYIGKGQGPIPKQIDSLFPILYEPGSLIENTNGDGVHPVQAANFFDYTEPINPNSLQFVKKSGKVMLNPGALKTSKLYDSHFTAPSKLLQAIAKVYTVQYWTTPNLAKFQMFALEKMIGLRTTTPTDNTPVAIEWECQQDWTVYCHVRNKNDPIHHIVKYDNVDVVV